MLPVTALMMPQPPVSDPGSVDGPTMNYFGGPVIENVKVYTVMWGATVQPGTVSGIGTFVSALLSSDYLDFATQYATTITAADGLPGTGQTIGQGTFGGQYTITPALTGTTFSDAQLRAELAAQIQSGALPPNDANTFYMIYLPKGVRPKLGTLVACYGFYGYHEAFTMPDGSPVYYALMPECGKGFTGLTFFTSHELAEAITDPFPATGVDPKRPSAWATQWGWEVADMCLGRTAYLYNRTGTKYMVSQEWSEALDGCTTNPRYTVR